MIVWTRSGVRVTQHTTRLCTLRVRQENAFGDDPAEFIDTTLKVSERRYAALPEAWRKGFEPARTVKTGSLKVTIAPNEAPR